MSFALFILLPCLSLFLIPLLIPTWKWYWISSAIIGLPLIAIWAEYFLLQQGSNGSPGDGLGVALLSFPTVAFFGGMLARFGRWLIELKISEIRSRN